ncbi:MAG TPA: M64 family metallopeptidase [Ignavibacteriales bacterium]|nr:M64 family metallopeptidase [Ignavibacteriales bacterium]
MKTLVLFLFLTVSIMAQVEFNDYFEPKTLRIDYFHTGTASTESVSMDELRMEPFWGGSHKNLIDTFGYGKYMVMVFDSASNKLIYSRGYSTLFSEWQTTAEAKKTTKTFSETVTMPFPKKTIRTEFYSRDRMNKFQKSFEYYLNPKDYFISPELHRKYDTFEVLKSGDPEKKVDLVIIPDGYTKDEMEKFKSDCKRFAQYLFNASPYKENKDKFNVWGVEAYSEESGTDIPAKNQWKKTALNTTFYTFDLERYLMTSDNKSLRDIAANVPYDQIYILVNTNMYGGGAIYNHYSVCVSDNRFGEYVFTHEFGHGFAGLGDEYYTSDVAYENFYPEGVEPWEPNLTTMVHFENKWKDMVAQNVPVPTPADKNYEKTVGVFEGGGYVAKGVYRPSVDCTMKSISVNNFCPVCRKAIEKMIGFYSE